jgi:hypothetical protein
MIHVATSKLHWNYFLALERDLEIVSRYIEFSERNFDVYSIELAHLLFAAASEVDVIAKLLCDRFSPATRRENINDYRPILLATLNNLPNTEVFVPRFGLTLKPWENWAGPTNPDWWGSYNRVKHERDAHFGEATLKNALNALGALLIFNYYHYSYSLAPAGERPLKPKDTTQKLQPESNLLRFHDDCYYHSLAVTVRNRESL